MAMQCQLLTEHCCDQVVGKRKRMDGWEYTFCCNIQLRNCIILIVIYCNLCSCNYIANYKICTCNVFFVSGDFWNNL